MIAFSGILFLTLIIEHAPLNILYAVEIHPNAGTTSAAFLKLGAGCRAIAMGSAYAGLADDATALYWNPAGLAQLRSTEIEVYHNESFESIRNDFLGYARPLREGVFAAGVSGLYTPKDIERRSGLNEADPYEPLSPIEGYFQAYDIAAHAAYGRWLRNDLAAGAGVKFIQQTIDTESGIAAAADLGLLYRRPGSPLSLGCAVQNIGTPIKFIDKSYPLPLNFRLGAACRWNGRLVTTLDLNKPIDNFLFIGAGTEYTPIDFLSVRVGYRYRWYGLELGDMSGLSAGAGFNFKLGDTALHFDYAFVPFGVLGNSHRISLGMLFGHARVPPAEEHAARSTSDGASAAAPAATTAAPAPAEIAGAGGFTFHPAFVTARRKMASGRSPVYALRAVADSGDIRSIEGTGRTGGRMRIDFGEKPGSGTVYKYYMFRGAGDGAMRGVTVTLFLPGAAGPVIVRTAGNKTIEPAVVGQQDGALICQFTLDMMSPFRVEKQWTQP
jgi:hypothetical protein